MISQYLGSITMVLKLPFTRAASTNGLHRYNGFDCWGTMGEEGVEFGGTESVGEKVAEVGVGERLGPRGARLMERLFVVRNKQRILSKTELLLTRWN